MIPEVNSTYGRNRKENRKWLWFDTMIVKVPHLHAPQLANTSSICNTQSLNNFTPKANFGKDYLGALGTFIGLSLHCWIDLFEYTTQPLGNYMAFARKTQHTNIKIKVQRACYFLIVK